MPSATQPAVLVQPDRVADPMDEAVAEIQRADAEYRKAIAELENVVAAEKPRWRAEATHAFDANLAIIDAAVERQRDAFRLHPQDLDALDALHASYRKRIDFLQEAVVRAGAAAIEETL